MTIHYKKEVQIVSHNKILDDIYNMVLKNKDISDIAVAGQFVNIYCKDGSRLLPRPISICGIDKGKDEIRIVYRIMGKGTEEFSRLQPNDKIVMMGPLGNGFTLSDKKALIIGGGIGIPPMLQLSKELDCEKNIVLGYRDKLFLNHEFEEYGKVFVATEDGSFGIKGNVLDVIKEYTITADVIYACGPTPMLRAIQAYAIENHIEAQLSLEEHMACGIGACLACVCKSKEKDHHTNVHNKRVCKDGPVFFATEVTI